MMTDDEDKYLSTKNIVMDYLPEPTIANGVQMFDNANDAYIRALYDIMSIGTVMKRKGRLYISKKPYTFGVKNTEYSYIILPGSCYHDRPAWMLYELMDFFTGEEVVGGYSVAYDKHRRTVYPKGNGESDWGYKKALGAMNEDQLSWAQRSLRLDSVSRNCVISPWHAERDLKRYVHNKELDLQRGDTYQRLPCITTLQFTREDAEKALSCFQYQRSMDYTGAVHCDLWRFAEITDYLARTSYPGGFGGPITIFIGTLAIESYGAAAFVKFNKALEWWSSDEAIRNLHKLWPSHKDGYSYTEPNKPHNKQYEWFDAEIAKLLNATRAAYYCRYEELDAIINDIQYQYYKDYANALRFLSMMRIKEETGIAESLHDSKKVQASLAYVNSNGLVPAVGDVTNYYQYWCAVEYVRYCIVNRIYDIHDVWKVLPQDDGALETGVMIDALVFTGKHDRNALRKALPEYNDIIDWYEWVFG